MFKNILVPIDGSATALSAAHFAIELARSCGACIIALYVASPFERFFHGSVLNPIPADYKARFEQAEQTQANAAIAAVKHLAERNNVAFFSDIVFDKLAARGIL
jgi:nucleotide-binding universal stress UspA family protein